MRGYMFRNRWLALFFVAMVLAGVTRLVGTETDKGALEDAADSIVEQRETAKMLTSGTAAGEPDDITIEFTADEELIDPATGEDPTPIDEFAASQPAEVAEEVDVVIVPQDGGQTIKVGEQ